MTVDGRRFRTGGGVLWTWEWWWSEEGEASRRKMQGGKKEESVEIEFGFWIWEENWEREDREEVTENLHTVGRRGGAIVKPREAEAANRFYRVPQQQLSLVA